MTQRTSEARQDRDEATVLSPERITRLARCWIAVAAIAYVFDLLRQTGTGWTNGAGRPLGDDFLNYWCAANLAWHDKAAAIYDWFAFHRFEQGVVGAPIDFYHYSYPPVLLLLTAPLAALPYVPGLALWLLAGWFSFYGALRTAWAAPNALLLALATPAVFVNAVAGQNGTWTAALLGGGLSLLDRRPLVAGIMLGCLCYKPQLALLVPVALIAGRRWPAFVAEAMTSAVLVLASVMLFGVESWRHYFDNVSLLRRTILEDGTGVWHRMLSVFVFARHLGAGVSTAYAAQAVTGVIAASIVSLAWRRDVDQRLRSALVVLGSCLATPYLQDYDLVVGAFVVAWVVTAARGPTPLATAHEDAALVRRSLSMQVIAALVLAAPFVAAPLAKATGLAWGSMMLAAAFVLTARMAFARRELAAAAASAAAGETATVTSA